MSHPTAEQWQSDPSSSEFIEHAEYERLSNLAAEFYVIDRSGFAFRSLSNGDIRVLHGLPFNADNWNPSLRGNYVAGSIQRTLRLEARQNVTRLKDMQALFHLPFELVLEIFGQLHPIDLYSLIRTCKDFRKTLLSRAASSVWQNAFTRHPDIPACPEDLSLPKWTTLLFGPSRCDECGDHGAMPDFALRLHFCDACITKTCLFFDDLRVSPVLLGRSVERIHLVSLIPGTFKCDGIIYPRDERWYEPRYFRKDFDAMEKKLLDFIARIDSGASNAKEDYEKFRRKTAQEINARMEHARACNLWSRGIYDEVESVYTETIESVLRCYVGRLQRLGYHPDDVEDASNSIEGILRVNLGVSCSKKVFLKYLPQMKEELSYAYSRRLEKEAILRLESRRDWIADLYMDIQVSLDPLSWSSLPAVDRLYELELIADYIKTDDDSTSPNQHKDELLCSIKKFVDEWFEDGKKQMQSLLPGEWNITKDDDDSWFAFAEAVFICPAHSDTALIGWRDVGIHLNCLRGFDPNFSLDLSFSPLGSRTAAEILSSFGLITTKTLATDLDKLDRRFICASCPEEGKRGRRGQRALTWREYISHVIQFPVHEPHAFIVLSEEMTKSVLFHEQPYPPATDDSWSCLHCSFHSQEKARRRDVIAHLMHAHEIRRPTVDVDFFYYRYTEQPMRKPYLLHLNEPGSYRCARCPPTLNLRLWHSNQVISHLLDKHAISNAEEKIDYFLQSL